MSKFTWGQVQQEFGTAKSVTAIRVPLTLNRAGKADVTRLTWLNPQDPDLEIKLMANSQWRREQEKFLLNKAAELG